MIRVLVASDYPMVRAGLRALLDDQEGLAIVGQTPGGEELVAAAGELLPDVVLLDLSDEEENLAQIGKLGQAAPDTSVIVLGGSVHDDVVTRALAAGARGYLLKEASREELAAAITAVHQGLVTLHAAAARASALRGAASPAEPATAGGETLTARELEVLALLAQGLPNKTIATRLHVSEHTVKFHVASIIGKLGVASRTEAVTQAARRGLISL